MNFKGSQVYRKIESIIDQRVDIKARFSNKLWTSYLYNSLLFHDLLLYQDYNNGADPNYSVENGEVMLDMVKVVTAAANVDGDPGDEEFEIFEGIYCIR
ncbi:MAG: hypothetical protein IPO32_13015 [Crocinitomicaceae bacterium]|nr:hypothetical protein [Crocinitomicaceae bacterium]